MNNEFSHLMPLQQQGSDLLLQGQKFITLTTVGPTSLRIPPGTVMASRWRHLRVRLPVAGRHRATASGVMEAAKVPSTYIFIFGVAYFYTILGAKLIYKQRE